MKILNKNRVIVIVYAFFYLAMIVGMSSGIMVDLFLVIFIIGGLLEFYIMKDENRILFGDEKKLDEREIHVKLNVLNKSFKFYRMASVLILLFLVVAPFFPFLNPANLIPINTFGSGWAVEVKEGITPNYEAGYGS